MKERILLLAVVVLCGGELTAQDRFAGQRDSWLTKAEENIPRLVHTVRYPVGIVDVVSDENSFQGWRVDPVGGIADLYGSAFPQEGSVIVDFGEHLTGYVSVSLAAAGKTPDSPARFRFTFGEVPSEMVVPFDPWQGGLSRAWMQDETVTVTTVPGTVEIPRRLAFRYMKIELVAAPSYDFSFAEITCRAVTSAVRMPGEIPESVPQVIRDIDRVALNTLKECMQTVYEDGPKRDRRLWLGDLYLESMGNNYSFRQFDLTRRCLYMMAGLTGGDGFLYADAFELPEPHVEAGQFLYEYALLFAPTLKDYLTASDDRETAEDLWHVARRQLDIIRDYLGPDHLIDLRKLESSWRVFMDWKEGLHKEVAVQGVALFALRETLELARMLGYEEEVADIPSLIGKMKAAARRNYLDKRTGLFVGKLDPQISYASQIWMVLGGVPTPKEGARALHALETVEDVCRPGTPYLYHYYIQALVNCGMDGRAREALVEYWGGMVEKGADTFWEAYDPNNDFVSPYNFYPLNSYCHAWSCIPTYFIRKYPDIFQK